MEDEHNPCAGCVYRGITDGQWSCDYLLKTGRRRPCPFGAGCTAKQTKEEDSMPKKTWDKDMALKLWEDGKNDREIADAVGVTPPTVFRWRRNKNLKPNYDPSSAQEAPAPKEPELPPTEPPKEPEPPPVSASLDPSPPEAPAPSPAPAARDLGPVELNVELKDGWARLRAPNWEQAAKLWKMLDTCIAALAQEGGDG